MGCINDVWLPLFHSQAEAYAAARPRAGAGLIVQSSYPETAEIVSVRAMPSFWKVWLLQGWGCSQIC